MTRLNKIRVLHITSSFPLRSNAISGIFIHRLVQSFSDDVETTILTPDACYQVRPLNGSYTLKCARYAPKKLQKLAHEPGGLPGAMSRSKWLIFLMPLYLCSMLYNCFILSRKHDLIHAHWALNGFIASIITQVTNRKLITTLRGEDVNRSSNSKVHRLILRLCAKKSDIVVTVGKRMGNRLIEILKTDNDKTVFISNGVGDEYFNINRNYCSKKRIKTILTVGTLVEVKGTILVLSALNELSDRGDWLLKIVGTGPEYENLFRYVKDAGIADRVEFLGQVDPAGIPKLLELADIFIQASYSEGRPNALVEAMASGIPVVGSDIEAITEIIVSGRDGLSFRSGDAGDLALAINKLLEDDVLRASLGQAARQRMLDLKLTWSACAKEYTALYKSVLRIEDPL